MTRDRSGHTPGDTAPRIGLSVTVTDDDLTVIEMMCAALGLTVPNLIRSALWSLATYQNMAPPGAFALYRDRPETAQERGDSRAP